MDDSDFDSSNVNRPGGKISARPLHFFWVCDCSGSMSENGKIFQLNNAIREALPHMVEVADDNPNAEILIRTLKFSSNAAWVQPQSVPIHQFEWEDLSAEGETKMGQALSILAKELKIPAMSERALKPVIVLISDGQPTDNFKQGLEAFMREPWGKKAVRLAIAIGRDAKEDVLQEFIGNSEIRPFQANSPEKLAGYIQFVSTFVLKETSSPASTHKEVSSSQLSSSIFKASSNISQQITEDEIW